MNTSSLIQSSALALCFEGAAVPDWVQLTPAGPDLPSRDGRRWKMSDPAIVLSAFAANRAAGQDVPVDFEHATHVKGPSGEMAPAVGWVEELDVRTGALWGRIKWNETGHTAIASRAYRYVSPGFMFDPKTLAVQRLVSVGLTNLPNFTMPALNRSGDQKETDPMDKAVLEALGLNTDATAAQAVVAITKLRDAERLALNSAQMPDASKFVPMADHQLALNRIATFTADEKSREEANIIAAVDAAVTAGKIAPASKDYHLASCRVEGGLERFTAFVAASPEIAAKSDLDKKANPGVSGILTADELAVCRATGMTTADFIAARDKKE